MWRMLFDIVRIKEVRKEGKGIATLLFPFQRKAVPGQFVMIWIPGVDEVPMSLSYIGDVAGVTVKDIGEATAAMSSMKEGDNIGIRGPYGNGFKLGYDHVLCVGGGVGMAPVMTAVELIGDRSKVDVAIGARNKFEVIFEERARRAAGTVNISTDDGSYGMKGNAVSLAKSMMLEKKYDMVLGCGPEIMNRYLLQACQELKVPCQLSLERLMKCGCGICGSCVMDGHRVCVEGPVFSDQDILDMPEFGTSRRDCSGNRIKAC